MISLTGGAGLRRIVRSLLLLSVVVFASMPWWPDKGHEPTTRQHEGKPGTGVLLEGASEDRNVESGRTLPDHLTRVALEKATFDPFVGIRSAAALPPPVPAVSLPLDIGPSIAPPPSYRYMGKMVDPMGNALVYLVQTDKEIPILVGTELADGYVVEAVSEEEIRLKRPGFEGEVILTHLLHLVCSFSATPAWMLGFQGVWQREVQNVVSRNGDFSVDGGGVRSYISRIAVMT